MSIEVRPRVSRGRVIEKRRRIGKEPFSRTVRVVNTIRELRVLGCTQSTINTRSEEDFFQI